MTEPAPEKYNLVLLYLPAHLRRDAKKYSNITFVEGVPSDLESRIKPFYEKSCSHWWFDAQTE